MNSGIPFDQLRSAETIPQGSIFPMSMGDGTGTKKVTKETLEKEVGKALKIGNLTELQTEEKTSIVSAINEVKQSGGSGGTSVDILDSQEEIEANTETGKVAGALAVQEMFGALNDKLTLPDGTAIYIDMKDGAIGYNTDPERGADTFFPFKCKKTYTLEVNVTNYGSQIDGSASLKFGSTLINSVSIRVTNSQGHNGNNSVSVEL